jgi:hypothetical protein
MPNRKRLLCLPLELSNLLAEVVQVLDARKFPGAYRTGAVLQGQTAAEERWNETKTEHLVLKMYICSSVFLKKKRIRAMWFILRPSRFLKLPGWGNRMQNSASFSTTQLAL